ncbi:MAG TPA: hypothetical protein VEP90_22865, partial [Methylomirabilota bacterium]|nr:hypothetical protein [Methylomirabilota bacterium]
AKVSGTPFCIADAFYAGVSNARSTIANLWNVDCSAIWYSVAYALLLVSAALERWSRARCAVIVVRSFKLVSV